jgi:hypothetical protein
VTDRILLRKDGYAGMKHIPRILLALLLAVAGLTAASATAQAAVSPHYSCTPSSCDHKDPIALGCDKDATTVASATYNGGTVLLRWSAKCGVNWAAHEDIHPFWCFTISVDRKGVTGIGAATDSYRYCNGLNPSSASFAWTNVLYAPTARSEACVNFDDGTKVCTPYT